MNLGGDGDSKSPCGGFDPHSARPREPVVTTTQDMRTGERARSVKAHEQAAVVVRFLVYELGVNITDEDDIAQLAAIAVALLRRLGWIPPAYDPTRPRGTWNPPRAWTEEDAVRWRRWATAYRAWLRSLPPPPALE